MTIKIYLIISLLFIEISAAFAQVKREQENHIPNTAYCTGEILKYDVKYGFIKGGEATLSINIMPVGPGFVYHIKALAETAGIAKKMFTIQDVYESFVDIETKLPIKAIRNIREENYTSYNEVLFDRDKKQVISLKSGKHAVPDSIMDIISAFYYARSYLFEQVIKKGQIINLLTYFDDEIFPLKIKFRKKDRIKTKFGKLECLMFVPVVVKGGPFKQEKDLRIWVTDDQNFIPVKIKAEVFFSSIYCELNAFSGLKNELEITSKPQSKNK